MPFRSKSKGRGTRGASDAAAAGSASAAAAAPVSNPRLDELWERFATVDGEPDPDLMDMEGISNLCSEVGVDAEADVRALMLIFKLGAKSKPGHMTKAEFVQGMTTLGFDSIRQLSNLVPQLDPGFLDNADFREFYRFVFQFTREGTHKTIEKDLIVALLPMAIGNRSVFLDDFIRYLEQATQHTRITLDQWDSFLQFSISVNQDLSDYDEDGAWPLLLDDFVEWKRGQDSSGRK